MAFVDDIKTIRDYVQSAVNSTWTDVEHSHEHPLAVQAVPFAQVRIASASLEPETVTSDVARLVFEIGARWSEDGSANDELVEKGAALRSALLADKTAGGPGYLPIVSEISLDQNQAIDVTYELMIRFEVSLTAVRT